MWRTDALVWSGDDIISVWTNTLRKTRVVFFFLQIYQYCAAPLEWRLCWGKRFLRIDYYALFFLHTNKERITTHVKNNETILRFFFSPANNFQNGRRRLRRFNFTATHEFFVWNRIFLKYIRQSDANTYTRIHTISTTTIGWQMRFYREKKKTFLFVYVLWLVFVF